MSQDRLKQTLGSVVAHARGLESDNDSLRGALTRVRSVRSALSVAVVVAIMLGLGAGWYLGSLATQSLPLQAGQAIVQSLAESMSAKGIIDKALERQAELGSAADTYVSIIESREDEIRDLKSQLEADSEESDKAHEVVLAAAEDDQEASLKLGALTDSELEACSVPLAAIEAKDLRIAALENENGVLVNRVQKANELAAAAEKQSGLWANAYDKQKERADIGADALEKLRKRRLRVRPGVFAGIVKPHSGPYGWSPGYGFGITLTYGR